MIDFSQLDKVIHEKARLSIVTLLASRKEWSFADLGKELSMSDGNLITHLRTLAKAEYVLAEKQAGPGRPRSVYSLTKSGRKAFDEYLAVLEAIVAAAKK